MDKKEFLAIFQWGDRKQTINKKLQHRQKNRKCYIQNGKEKENREWNSRVQIQKKHDAVCSIKQREQARFDKVKFMQRFKRDAGVIQTNIFRERTFQVERIARAIDRTKKKIAIRKISGVSGDS